MNFVSKNPAINNYFAKLLAFSRKKHIFAFRKSIKILKMKDITISHFRCYDYKTMDFRKGINLLIGDNSCGKTSLIRACNFVANSLFCGYSDENTNWKSVEDADFKLNVDANNTILPENPISK